MNQINQINQTNQTEQRTKKMSKFLGLIKGFVGGDRLAFKKHAILRMYQRGIKADEVKEALLSGEVIEDYSDDRPLPSFLILGYSLKKRPLHIVAAIDVEGQMVWIITVYEPSRREWEEGYRKRRKG